MTDLSFQPSLALNLPPAAGHAQLTNMSLGLRTYLDCADAAPSLPRIGTFHGPSGFGKSVAMAFAAQRSGAAYVEAKSIWTQRSLLEAIAEELGVTALGRSAPRILEQIIELLNTAPRGLIIDEADHIVKKQHVEILRDIHDATRIPILLVGEEALPAKLRAWERFHNRILVSTPAQPASVEDAFKLRAHYCPHVEIADDLVVQVVSACRGVTRRIVVNLFEIARLAIEEDAAIADLAWWGDRSFRTGEITVRRLAA
jgi:DNA transposition AAA+ family ATPase